MWAESRSTWPPGQAGTWNASRLSLRLTSFLAWTERTVRWQETTFLPFTRTLENRQTFKQCLFSIIELYISWKSVVVRMALMPITGRRRRLSQKRWIPEGIQILISSWINFLQKQLNPLLKMTLFQWNQDFRKFEIIFLKCCKPFYKKVPSDIHLQIFIQKGSEHYKQNIITKINSILM